MDRPAAILLVLASLGIGCAGLLWGTKTNRGIARGFQDEREMLLREHELELSRVRDGMGQQDSDSGDAELLERIERLEGELKLYQDENARLLEEIDKLVAAGGTLKEREKSGETTLRTGFSDKEEAIRGPLEKMVTTIRELEFTSPPVYDFTDWAGMKAEMRSELGSAGEGTERSRAYAAMGFVEPGTDVAAQMANLMTNQLGAAAYIGGSAIRFNGFGSLMSIHDRTALAVELIRLLQGQHFDFFVPTGDFPNADARNAARALATGDAELVKVRFMLRDEFPSSDELTTSPTAMSKEEFQAAPPFIREEFLFPFTVGMSFCQALHERGDWDAVNAAYRRLPRTTAEILHPELYLAEPPFEAVDFEAGTGSTDVLGSRALCDDRAGELGIAVYLNQADYTREMETMGIEAQGMMPVLAVQDFSEKPGGRAAAGWRGDRYLVYPNGDGAGGTDHVLWQSAWANEEDAREFFAALRDALRLRYGLPGPKAGGADQDADAADDFRLETPRHVRLWMPEDRSRHEVRLVNAGNAEWLEALVKTMP